jgi:hypothetical protein
MSEVDRDRFVNGCLEQLRDSTMITTVVTFFGSRVLVDSTALGSMKNGTFTWRNGNRLYAESNERLGLGSRSTDAVLQGASDDHKS